MDIFLISDILLKLTSSLKNEKQPPKELGDIATRTQRVYGVLCWTRCLRRLSCSRLLWTPNSSGEPSTRLPTGYMWRYQGLSSYPARL